MSTLVVIARYKEDVKWVRKLELPYLIINKGPPIQHQDIAQNSVSAPNSLEGREAHSYLWYILNYYDSLPDKVIFLQADPFEHQPDILKILNEDAISKLDGCVGLTRYYKEGIPHWRVRKSYGQYFINNVECWSGYYDDNFIDAFPKWQDCFVMYAGPLFLQMSNIDLTNKTMRQGIFEIFEIPYVKDKISPYFFAAQFLVTKNRILTRSKEYYERILECVDTTSKSGYILERIWCGIFGDDMNRDIKELREEALSKRNGAIHLC
jgi:hypothetical protein